MVKMIRYVQEHAEPGFVPAPIGDSQINDLMQRSHQAIAFEQASIKDTVNDFFDQAEQILS
jgi:multiple sugar transport system substrate-binding protein